MNLTRRLREGIGQEEQILPVTLLDGLRAALDAGLSCEQITAHLILAAGLYEASGNWDGDQLIARVKQIVEVIKGQRKVDSLKRDG